MWCYSFKESVEWQMEAVGNATRCRDEGVAKVGSQILPIGLLSMLFPRAAHMKCDVSKHCEGVVRCESGKVHCCACLRSCGQRLEKDREVVRQHLFGKDIQVLRLEQGRPCASLGSPGVSFC